MYQFSGMNVSEAGLKEGLYVPAAVEHPGYLNTEAGGPVKDDVVPDRRTTKLVSKFGAGATQERVRRQQAELGVEAIVLSLGQRYSGLYGDVAPNIE